MDEFSFLLVGIPSASDQDPDLLIFSDNNSGRRLSKVEEARVGEVLGEQERVVVGDVHNEEFPEAEQLAELERLLVGDGEFECEWLSLGLLLLLSLRLLGDCAPPEDRREADGDGELLLCSCCCEWLPSIFLLLVVPLFALLLCVKNKEPIVCKASFTKPNELPEWDV